MKQPHHLIDLSMKFASIDNFRFFSNHKIPYSIHLSLSLRYPCYNTVRTLLQCGADPNASDAIGNTPLHIFVSNVCVYNEKILQLLCDAGAHLDYTNALEETPVNIISRVDLKQLVQTKTKIKLKCICARLIRREHIQYQEQIPRTLVDFVQRH